VQTKFALIILCVSSSILMSGCGNSEDVAPRNTKEAASQLQQAFEAAPAAVKQSADAAADAMQKGEYEKAVVSLEVARSSPNVTVQQGLAIHRSAVTMEAQLISRMEAGDPNARRAYELLKRFKQK
jgi:hypothetical protein